MLTKDILFGMNILTLAGFLVMGVTLILNRTGQAGKALSIGLMGAGTVLVFLGLYAGGLVGVTGPPLVPAARSYPPRSLTRMSSAGTPSTRASAIPRISPVAHQRLGSARPTRWRALSF
jgi:hypothetical protein